MPHTHTNVTGMLPGKKAFPKPSDHICTVLWQVPALLLHTETLQCLHLRHSYSLVDKVMTDKRDYWSFISESKWSHWKYDIEWGPQTTTMAPKCQVPCPTHLLMCISTSYRLTTNTIIAEYNSHLHFQKLKIKATAWGTSAFVFKHRAQNYHQAR